MPIKQYNPTSQQWEDYDGELTQNTVGRCYVNGKWRVAWRHSTITYCANYRGDGSDTSAEKVTQTVISGTPNPIPHTRFKKGTSALIKFNTQPDGSGTDYAVSGKIPLITVDKDVTLYAIWESDWKLLGAGNSSYVLYKDVANKIFIRPCDGVEGTFVGTGNTTWYNVVPASRTKFSELQIDGMVYGTGSFRNFMYSIMIPYIDVSNFILTNVTDIAGFYQACDKLVIADFSNISTNTNCDTLMMVNPMMVVKQIIIGKGFNEGNKASKFPYNMYRLEDGQLFTTSDYIPSYIDNIASVDSSGKKTNNFINGKLFIFNANGGTGLDKKQVVAYFNTSENKLPIYDNSDNRFIKDGYVLTGWNTATDGTGISYALNAELDYSAVSDNTTLYAQWQSV